MNYPPESSQPLITTHNDEVLPWSATLHKQERTDPVMWYDVSAKRAMFLTSKYSADVETVDKLIVWVRCSRPASPRPHVSWVVSHRVSGDA